MENKKMMKVVMLVEILIMLVMLQISPSSAQNRECLLRISTCLDGASTHPQLLECCPIIKQEIKDERDCFCLLKDNALEDESFSDALSTVFSFCGISDTIHTLCPGPNPSPSGSLNPTPPSPTSTPIETPISSPAGSGDCWDGITNCVKTSTTPSEMLECCPLVKKELANDRECFCTAKARLHGNPSAANSLSEFFTHCGIPGSLDTLCPGSPSSSGEHLIPPPAPIADTNNPTSSGKESESRSLSGSTNKIAYSVGLFPSLLLFIWATSVLIGYL
ncbi:uncharacterized protein LOC104892075 isoform X3 [Beta vulgaris subsp. vulgaris]|uniref:uncharacterized protein LOC104892075 isoform X3 n=1 Tax=Beta vulgaris subsp. vulgaris TaxID=3555 RepID=UPI002036FBB7|nr:uncharacterized protein LOC104892075 isoform X3 [Beta vulgaris subsp. vulgaris]